MRGWRGYAGLAVGALLVALLTSCDGDEVGDDGVFDYAALGDSFTAAPWLPTTSDDGCERSDRNYPHLLAEKLNDVRLLDVSCGGATTEDIITSQEQLTGRVQTPQIEVVSADTDLVTIGIGANDLGAAYTTIYECVQLAQHDGEGSPCADAHGHRVDRLMSRIENRVAEVLDTVTRRAPEAQVILVGYPRLLPDSGSCPGKLPLAEGDLDYVRDNVASMAEATRAAAAEADVEYVNMYRRAKGHDVCSDDPWVQGRRKDPETGAAPYHPTPAFQEAVAEVLHDLL